MNSENENCATKNTHTNAAPSSSESDQSRSLTLESSTSVTTAGSTKSSGNGGGTMRSIGFMIGPSSGRAGNSGRIQLIARLTPMKIAAAAVAGQRSRALRATATSTIGYAAAEIL